MAASAQAPNGSTHPEAALRQWESYAKTANGCTMIIGPYPSMSENDRAQVTYAYTKDTWQGACIDGLAMGPGTLIDRNYEGTAVDYIREGCYFYGRRIGAGRIARVYSGGNAEYFVWNGVEYIVYGDMENPTPGLGGSEVLVYAPDRRLRYKVENIFCGGTPLCVVEYNLNNTQAGGTKYPCSTDCRSMWQRRVGPILKEYQAFRQRFAPEVAAAKQAATSALAALSAGNSTAPTAQEKQEVADAYRQTDENTRSGQARAAEQTAKRQAAYESARNAERAESTARIGKALGTLSNIYLQNQGSTNQPAAPAPRPARQASAAPAGSQAQLLASIKAAGNPECVDYRKNRFYNLCNFAIEITFCIEEPLPFDKAPLSDAGAAYDCAKNQYGLWTIDAGSAMPGSFSGTRAIWGACRKPYSPVKIFTPGGAHFHFACK